MITFEINKWVLVAIICGIMLLGALVELLIACIYSKRVYAGKTVESEKGLKTIVYDNELLDKLSDDLEQLQQRVEFQSRVYDDVAELARRVDNMEYSQQGDSGHIEGLREKYSYLEKKYEDVLEKQAANERRIDQTTRAFNRFKTDTYDDFHDLEEHVHNWLNSKPVIKVKDKDMEVESYIHDYYMPTRTEAVLKAKDKDTEARAYARDCYVPTSKEALRIIRNLYDKFNEQGYLTVAEYRAEFEKDRTFLQENYGWTEFDFSAVYAQRVDGAYKVHMPEPILLCDD